MKRSKLLKYREPLCNLFIKREAGETIARAQKPDLISGTNDVLVCRDIKITCSEIDQLCLLVRSFLQNSTLSYFHFGPSW